MRTTVDVAWNGSVNTAVWGCVSWVLLLRRHQCGRSSWAGVAAAAAQPAGHPLAQLNPRLHQISQNPILYARDFHRVTEGSNTFFGPGYGSGPGCDLPTGLGSPSAKCLVCSLAGRF